MGEDWLDAAFKVAGEAFKKNKLTMKEIENGEEKGLRKEKATLLRTLILFQDTASA